MKIINIPMFLEANVVSLATPVLKRSVVPRLEYTYKRPIRMKMAPNTATKIAIIGSKI